MAMIQTIPANQVTLRTLKEQFGLQLSQDEQFFPEWRLAKPSLSETEEQILERVKDNFYANSRLLSLLNPEPELGSVLQILKRLGEVAVRD
ncbi:MAG: hypothetical protein LAT50_16795 [Ectothiorhodospiraceae bacterium]|nr:hypothetical protein [Ectothiorhodospiraceae bacterium]